jgi:hypothetical protein
MRIVRQGKSTDGQRSWAIVENTECERIVADVILARLADSLSDVEECERWAKHFFDVFVHRGDNQMNNYDEWRQFCGFVQ